MIEIIKGNYLGGKENKLNEKVVFDLSNQGANLFMCLGNITEGEIQSIEQGSKEFKLFYKDGIIFFLAKFGKMDWLESPFHIILANKGNAVEIPNFREDEGLGMTFFAVEASNSIVKTNIGLVGLNHDFTNVFLSLIQKQKEDIFIKSDYDNKLENIYKSYDVNKMAEEAISVCKFY